MAKPQSKFGYFWRVLLPQPTPTSSPDPECECGKPWIPHSHSGKCDTRRGSRQGNSLRGTSPPSSGFVFLLRQKLCLYKSAIRFAAGWRASYLQRGRSNKDDKNLILARGMQAVFCPGYTNHRTHFILWMYNKSAWLLPFRCPLAAGVNEFMRVWVFMFNFITVRVITSLFIAVISYSNCFYVFFYRFIAVEPAYMYIHVAISYSSLLHDTAAHI
jgi:hypothetical protein